jgi:hypothetical protein
MRGGIVGGRPQRTIPAPRAPRVARPPSRARIRGGRGPPSWCRKSEKGPFSNMDHATTREPQTESQATKVSVPRRSPTARRHRAPPPPRWGARPGDRQACIFTLLPARPNPRRTPSAPSSSTTCALTTTGALPRWSRVPAGAGRRRGAVQWAEWRRRPRCLLASAASKPALLRARTPAYLHCPKLRENAHNHCHQH